MNDLEDAFRAAGGIIEQLVRAIVRDELRRHLGPEADHFINVKDAPIKARKLRQLIRSGDLRGYKHGRDVLVAASDLRAFIEGRPVEPRKPIAVPEPPPNRDHDVEDELRISLGVAPADPVELRAFEARIAERRAGGGERAASLLRVEEETRRRDERERRRQERALEKAKKKGKGPPS